jgi:uncharacterized protein with HEPN domain
MMSLQEKKLLTDIKIAAESIGDHLEQQYDFALYKASKTKRRAVERELEIIGEAMNNLLKVNPLIQLSYTRVAVDLRNRIIHAYDNINDTIIWNIIITTSPFCKRR